jgi:sensor c-di-GMP phosphodiesterase-like protein
MLKPAFTPAMAPIPGVESIVRALKSHKLLAAALGIVLASLPVYWFTSWLQSQGEAEVAVAADWTTGALDQTLDGAVGKLDELAARGIDSCSAAAIETLRQSVFAAGPIKQFGLVGADGRTMCTDMGQSFAPRYILATAATSRRDVMLDVVRLEGRDEHLLRVRLVAPERKPSLAALLPADLLLPRVAPDGRRLAGYARLTLADGTLIGTSKEPTGSDAHGDYISARARSQRYGAVATLTMLRSGTIAGRDDLRRIGIVVSGLFALTILLGALFIPWRERRNPVAEIEAALVADEFVPYYQPIIDIKTGKLLGAEVLVRWHRANGSVVTPGAFIPLVESSGLILEFTRSLMRQVCKDVGVLIGERPRMYVAFNIAPRHFADAAVLNDVGAIFEDSPIRLSQIVLEITERVQLENLTAARRVIAALQALGCRVALDDVGTGHSGLSYILKLGVDVIKIDRLFVEAIKSERHAQAIVETLVTLARNLRMQIVAEGVERMDQVEYLRESGIRAAQGFLFAPPLPGRAFIKLVEAMEPRSADAGAGAAPIEPPVALGALVGAQVAA